MSGTATDERKPLTLPEIRTAAAQLVDTLKGYGDKARELRETPREKHTTESIHDLRLTTALIQSADAELTHLLTLEHDARSAAMPAQGAGPIGATGATGQGIEMRSAGRIFTETADVAAWMGRSGAKSASPAVEIERRTLITSGTSSNDGGLLLPKGSPFISPGGIDRRRLFVRDVISPGTTTLSSVPYVREYTPRTTELGASGQVEGSAKAEVQMLFESDDAPVRTIAGWVPVTNQVLEDVPTLASYIDGRLPYMVMLREEEQMLRGPGTGSQLKGILQFSGVQAQTFSSSLAATLGLAVSKIELVDGEADAIAINPTDFWTMVTTRNSSRFDGEAVADATENGAPFGPPAITVWGLPAIRSRSVTAGTPIVGAWRMGAQVFDRSTVSIRYSDNYSDYFVKNMQVILAEARLGLAVHRADYFVTVATS
jgi:HK97 family phage major capsid protein